jgi:hypothetical protein
MVDAQRAHESGTGGTRRKTKSATSSAWTPTDGRRTWRSAERRPSPPLPRPMARARSHMGRKDSAEAAKNIHGRRCPSNTGNR